MGTSRLQYQERSILVIDGLSNYNVQYKIKYINGQYRYLHSDLLIPRPVTTTRRNGLLLRQRQFLH